MPGAALTQHDLIAHEHFLRDIFSRFLAFKTHSLYFPKTADDALAAGFGPDFATAVSLPGERRVMVPLCAEGRLLGVFVARGASLGAPRTLLPLLPRVAAMALGQLRLTLAAATDSLTGLATGGTLLAAVTREIECVQDRILPGAASLVDPGLSGWHGGFGLVVLDLDHFSRVAGRFGFVAAEDVLARAGAVIGRLCPEGGLAARLHDDLFGLFFAGGLGGQVPGDGRSRAWRTVPDRLPHPVHGRIPDPVRQRRLRHLSPGRARRPVCRLPGRTGPAFGP
ncbi:TPR repeat [Desulfovibrio sp. DV]|uniref:GGDEF domain-containing protein n=1 Tax=Desulfovibrio sp. DV TaxID=1844708 RepID=UPI00095B1B93|nr:GGDEF domain-containing protein [Desulfovibrio sp. DV]OLN28224.1 TPR repeat [Desulfovibrio sp. DV]